MSKIVIGTTGSKNVSIDLDTLLRTRLLIQANSGKGKSWLLRRLAEQLFGKVQVIIIDPEGEFATLREQFDFVLVGKGGETAAHPRIAALTAQRLLELKACAVCDLYEMKPSERHSYVRAFLDALIDAPKNLWHPLVVIVDEAHVYCPEKGAGESEASEAVISMATRGRKRGYCLVAATQRLGKFRKDAAAELINVAVGGTFIDIDRKRAADVLGVYGAELHPFFDQIKALERGKFYFLGPAISTERVLVQVGAVETTHPEAGSAKHAAEPPPTPQKIKALLPSLADLPKEAEEKAKTIAEFQHQVRSLKAQLAARPTEVKQVVEEKIVEVPVLQPEQIRELTEAIEQVKQVAAIIGTALAAVRKAPPIAAPRPQPIRLPQTLVPKAQVCREVEPSNGLKAAQIKVLSRLVELLECTGAESVKKEQLAAWAEYSPNSGGFNNYLGNLRSAGLIEYPSGGYVTITDDGRQHAQPENVPASSDELLERAKRVLGGSEGKLLELLHATHPEMSTKVDLAEAAGFSPNSGGFNNYLGHMRTLGFVEYPKPGMVRAADWLFI